MQTFYQLFLENTFSFRYYLKLKLDILCHVFMYLSTSYLQVSAFSTWDKELHKIVFDPRYLLLNPKERKLVSSAAVLGLEWFAIKWTTSLWIHRHSSEQVFDQYVKTRAEEERKERKNKLMQAKDDFRKMMEDAKLNIRSVVRLL